MNRNFHRLASWALIATVLGGCSSTSKSIRSEPSSSEAPVRFADLVDTHGFTEDEEKLFDSLIRQEPSPEPRIARGTLDKCLQAQNIPHKCRVAARYVGRLVKEGYGAVRVDEFYALRFGPAHVDIPLGDVPTLGTSNADVTVVVYSDFQCPFCSASAPQLRNVVERFSGHVKLAFKHFPLTRIHPYALTASRAAVAAQKQGKFWEMHDLLFEHQDALGEQNFEESAKTLGLDSKVFAKDFSSPESEERVRKDLNEAEALGLLGTPTVFVNGRLFLESIEQLPEYIDEELSN